MIDIFKQKLAKLPKDVQKYLTSAKLTDFNVEIFNKYDLGDKNSGKVAKTVSSLYFKELKISDLVDHIEENFRVEKNTAKNIAKDMAGMHLLVVDDWIDADVPEYIRSLGGDPENYQSYVSLFDEAVEKEDEELKKEMQEEKVKPEALENFEEKEEKEGGEKEENDYKFDPEKEKEHSIDLFKNSLKYLLFGKSDDKSFLQDYNYTLIDLIVNDEDGNFQSRLEKSLFSNKEKLTNKEFVLKGERAQPTISNWLKFFIEKNGSDFFDSMNLSDFLANSENTRKLDEEERQRVKKILLLYRNIKFFSEVFKNKDVEEWEVIPVSREEEAIKSKENKKMPNKEFGDNKAGGNKDETKQPNKKRIDELKKMADQYEENSLERKAVEEEIKKIKEN